MGGKLHTTAAVVHGTHESCKIGEREGRLGWHVAFPDVARERLVEVWWHVVIRSPMGKKEREIVSTVACPLPSHTPYLLPSPLSRFPHLSPPKS